MSWLARSIANSLNLDDNNDTIKPEAKPVINSSDDDETPSPTSPSRGVKEDLSELTTTLTRQFWGVASFLAPPPAPNPRSDSERDPNSGIRTDFGEIGEKFRSGISRLSNNINVSEITKVATSFLQLESDDDDVEDRGKVGFEGGVLGVTVDVVAFARDLAMRPETWLNFPFPDNVGVDLGFVLSDAQQEHALAVERLAPELAALRIELCPGYMSESCFWVIYFLLIHPRLDKQDAELLSTPQIMKARALLAPEVNNQTTIKPEEDSEKENLISVETYVSEELSSVPSPSPSEKKSNKAPNLETSIKPAAESNEIQIDDRFVTEEKDANQVKGQHLKPGSLDVNVVKEDEDGDDADDWLKEENVETGGARTTTVPIENEDDVSFSDLEEEDDDGDIPASYRKSNDSSDKDSKDWVRIE